MDSTGKIIEVNCGDQGYYTADGDFTGSYYVYVPENVNPNTPVHIYIPGSGGSGNDTVPLTDYVNNNGSNSIVIMPQWNAVNEGPNNYAVASLKISDDVIEKYGLTGSNVTISGFSNGSRPAMLAACDSLSGDYKTKISAVVSIDGSVKLNSEEYELLAKNNVTVYAIIKKDDDSKELENYVKMGGQVVLMRAIGGHVEKNRNAFKNGIIDYLNGTGELSGLEGYTFEMFDTEKNSWYTLTYEELKQKIDAGVIDPSKLLEAASYVPIKFDIDEYEKIQSDDTVLQGYVDGIRNNLKIEASVHSYNSTTMVPSEESEVVHEFLEGTQSLFGIIESDTTYLLKMGLALKEMDANLAAKGMEIDDAPSKDGSSSSSLSGWEIAGIFLKNVAGGAAVGLVSGSFVPVIGNIAGAVIGAIAGVVTSFIQISASNSSNRTVTVNDNIDPIDINNR